MTQTLPPPSVPACMMEASAEFTLPPRVLPAVWLTEGGKIGTTRRNHNGSVDHGPFQINSVWIKQLHEQYGTTAALLTNNLCWSARAAAYILRYEINAAGGSFWDGVGHYHSHTPVLKAGYIARVYRNSRRF